MTDHHTTESGDPGIDYDVPPDRSAVECDYCGRPFADESLLALHRGYTHPTETTESERAAFEDAYETETSRLRRFRLKSLAALVLLYFGLLMVYALVI
jgi:hypothetical protein